MEQQSEVQKGTGHMREQGMTLEDEHGVGFAKKPTSYLTNSPCIADELSKQCENDADAIGIWRQTGRGVRKGQLPRRGGPVWESVRKRVTLDLTHGALLQDLRDVHNATDEQLRFEIFRDCLLVETIFYFVREGSIFR